MKDTWKKIVLATLLLSFALQALVDAAPAGWSDYGSLLANNPTAGQEYGFSVAVTDTHLLVGAPYANSGSAPGEAYLYMFDGNNWIQSSDVKTGVVGDAFGGRVALSSDHALIGAPQRELGKGAAYLYSISGTTWTSVALSLVGEASGDYFGNAVAISDSILLVGSPLNTNYQGAVYKYDYDGTTWSFSAKLVAPQPLDGSLLVVLQTL